MALARARWRSLRRVPHMDAWEDHVVWPPLEDRVAVRARRQLLKLALPPSGERSRHVT
eukprot:CAMPEP_0196741956 /NCGR_PEP_ID=MMETSP1091-20130531/43571_1 /TAXON_ID=302021 /ORGANISM="Rhodomonas sp., Strain CCMP768" /LENGTH=57 /DNA_ID=CAMNT_0042087843 /DNA_START=334 /DNA_END=504 /DNA_ORIENTATION=+